MKQWLPVIVFLTVAGLTAACSTTTIQSGAAKAQPDVPTFTTQSNSEQAVGVDVTPLNLPGGGTSLDFEVAFNTHSVNLDFDPVALSVLRDDEGREYPAIAWEGAGPGGHHRSGVLRFKIPDYATDFIEVVIHDVAGVPERVFHWSLTSS